MVYVRLLELEQDRIRGSHQAVRPLHPSHSRVITVREAARLRGFPRLVCFSPSQKWHKSQKSIGNSVSPIVSEAILSKNKAKAR
ncbi:DNA cytosine methyltransferase [Vibrio metschnikovii]